MPQGVTGVIECYGQGGQSVRFLENNANCNARLALKGIKFTSKRSGLIVL